MQSYKYFLGHFADRLDEVSSASGISSARLASLIDGSSDATSSELRDIAVFAGISSVVLQILEPDAAQELAAAVQANQTGFWGYLRVRLWAQTEPLYWPISRLEADRFRRRLEGETSEDLLEIDTLDARSLRISPVNVMSITLAEWRPSGQHQVEPVWGAPEVYRAARERAEGVPAFEARNSQSLQRKCRILIDQYGWTQDPKCLLEQTATTRVYTSDGRCERIDASGDSLTHCLRAISFGQLTDTLVSVDDRTQLHVYIENAGVIDVPTNVHLDGWAANDILGGG